MNIRVHETSRYICRKPAKGGWMIWDKINEKFKGSYKSIPKWAK